MSPLVNLEITDEQIGYLTLNRPEAANSLSTILLDELANTLEEVKQSNVNVLIVTGSGEKAFCAGADLKERAGMSEDEVVSTVEKIGDTIRMLEQIEIPTIAMINGAAYGGGLELALACDLRVMTSDAKVGLTETSLAIIPGAGGTQRLTRLIGLGRAKEMIFTAKPIDADKALTIGLVEGVYANEEEVKEQTHALAAQITKNGPFALKQAKKAIQHGIQTDITTGLEIERMCYQKTIPTKDRKEGLQAFKEKRKPNYTGK
ncbi:enoyl-CoA hydratase-related protein [Halobacillus amylolyticus]|uniref:Enoyl-CoA hydratase-related protein n=1 Tax=Halobacillus amylolyticus TaxID=2932259 RepID=A0ABY4HCY2_9BACI|nr:enoyl-CoA hydratase-related protein [Halobacillus amylolyticus]UOR12584.1 enoyl-CoA hydratase-related protein [Halobacillus amylolyticus]